jgi:tRNA A-37 threonylcarbamoyl transferase component Bud32
LTLPQRFGRYLLVERIAQGGMAEVFRAVQEGPEGVEKTVAIKRMLPFLHGAADFRARFVDEARIAMSLTHVNVTQVFEFGTIDGSDYLAMELVEGTDLGRLEEAARRRGVAPAPALAAFIGAEVARGLGYAHDKRGTDGASLGIVHRDVSPQNVLLSTAGEVKLADFGIAKAVAKLHRTESGAVLGKLRYMSPEQVTGEPLDGRSDLFSLGVVLWELFCGRALFDGEHPGQVSEQVKRAEIPPPSKIRPELDAALDRIVLKALARDREARFQKAGELARELVAWSHTRDAAAGREELGALVVSLTRGQAPVEDEGAATTVEQPAALTAPGKTPPLSRDPAPPTARARRAPQPLPPRSSSPLPYFAAAIVLASGGAAWKFWPHDSTTVTVASDAAVDGPPPSADGSVVATISPAERARLLSELEALPQAEAAWRGVAAPDYLALLSAADGAICASMNGEVAFPPEALARLAPLRLEPEARALARYLLAAGELPPRAAAALGTFLRGHPAFSPGPNGWALATLATRTAPERADHWIDFLRQNAALHRFADGGPCDRARAVAELEKRAPARAAPLERFLAATPVDEARDVDALRFQVTGAARDDAAATLEVRVRVTNPGAAEQPLPLELARLVGLGATPSVDPPAPRLPAGTVRDLRLTYAGVSDAIAEAAVLELRPGVQLQAYSELLR